MVFITKTPSWKVLLPSLRTQTKIKNYFYGNIRYFLKIIIKHFHRKSTGFVNDIKTETLLDLYEAKNSTTALNKIFRAFGLCLKPLNALNIEWTSIVVKILFVKMNKHFITWLKFSFKIIFQKTFLFERKKKNHSHKKKVKVCLLLKETVHKLQRWSLS